MFAALFALDVSSHTFPGGASSPCLAAAALLFCFATSRLRNQDGKATMSFACLEDGQALSDEVEISDVFDVETRASVQCGDGELRRRSVACGCTTSCTSPSRCVGSGFTETGRHARARVQKINHLRGTFAFTHQQLH